jgi:transcription antitermination factor NusG
MDIREENNKMLDIKGKKIAVLCDTEEKVREFCNAINYKVDKEIFRCDHPKRLYIGLIGGDLTWDSHDYFQRNNYKLITFDEFMNGKVEIKNEEKKVNKFKVGDKVRILDGSKIKDYRGGWCMSGSIGEIGIIKKVMLPNEYSSEFAYKINDLKNNESDYTGYTFDERGLELVSQSPIKTLTITTSDTITTLTDGSHITTINRFYTDKHDDMVALEEVVKKYKSEMEEIERAEKLPKVGDMVKIVDKDRIYSTYYKWFFENKITDECAMRWKYGCHPNNSTRVFRVVAIGKHSRDNDIIALITDDFYTYLIDIKGLEVIK